MAHTAAPPALVDQFRQALGTFEEATFELGGIVDRIAESSGLIATGEDGIRTLGAALGEALADVEIVPAEQLVWRQFACVQRAWLSDLEAIARMPLLEPLCAGFVAGRVARLAQDAVPRARDEGSRLAIVWTIRLTGYPLLYDYVERVEIVDFCQAGLAAVCDGLLAAGGLDQPGADAFWDELVTLACEQVSSASLRLSPEALGTRPRG